MNLEDFMDGEAFAYAPGHDGPFKVHAALDGALVRFVDDGGAVVLSGPADASLSRYEELGIGIHGWTVWKDGLPVVCKGDAGDAARVSRLLAATAGRRGVHVRQSVTGGDYIEPVGPYEVRAVSAVEADRESRPGLFKLVDAEGATVAHVAAGASADPAGGAVSILCRDSDVFWHRAHIVFPWER